MKVLIIGSGYVGLVAAVCFAEGGNQVLGVDVDGTKVAALSKGKSPIFEPGLEELLAKHLAARNLRFSTELMRAMGDVDVAFICVGTPQSEDGSADMKYVLAVAGEIGKGMALRSPDAPSLVVVDKSTVPVGTAARVHAEIAAHTDRAFEVVSNPEFLREGSALGDFLEPDRVVVGCRTDHAEAVMKALYQTFLDRSGGQWFRMDPPSAELTKYAANAMLATRISFMNELANLAEKVGADIESVRRGIGSDPRIGYDFLYAGAGYGGSCFPKDVKALIKTAAHDGGIELKVLQAVEAANQAQKQVLGRKIKARFGDDLTGRHFALWGLAFKANTDDMREATSRQVIKDLLSACATVTAYDPVAMPEAQHCLAGMAGLSYAANQGAALQNADALVIVTEWKEFRSPDFPSLKAALKSPVIFDGRNLYDPKLVRGMGFEYLAIGR